MSNQADSDETESLWKEMTSMFEGRSPSQGSIQQDETAMRDSYQKAEDDEQAAQLALLRAHQDRSEMQRQEQERSQSQGNMAMAIVGRINELTTQYMRLEATLSELVQENKELGDDWNYYTNDSQDELSGLQQRQSISLKMEAIRDQGAGIQARMKDILDELESYGVQVPKSGGRRGKTKGRRKKGRRKKKTRRRRE